MTTNPAKSNASTTDYGNSAEKVKLNVLSVLSNADKSSATGNHNRRSKREANSISRNGPIYSVRQNLNGSSPILVIELGGQNDTATARSEPPVARTKVILKPLARSIAGRKGMAISSPISTVFVKRGDYVEIEYLPEAIADVGEDGTAISRPELFIHFIDRRRK